jgi:hypothetical protein
MRDSIPFQTKMRTASQRNHVPLQTESRPASSGITGPLRPEYAFGALNLVKTPYFVHISRRARRVVEIDKEGSRLRGRVQGGTESLCFSTGLAALVFPYR